MEPAKADEGGEPKHVFTFIPGPPEARREPTAIAEPVSELTITGLDVRAALGALSPAHRRVIVEMYYNNLSVAETARALAIPSVTVESLAYYAIRQIRRTLVSSRHYAAEKAPDQRGPL